MEGIDPFYEEQYEQWKIKEKQMEEDNPYGFWPIIGKDLGKMIANWEKECEEYKKTLGPERLRFIKRCEMCANNIQFPLTCIGDQPCGEPKIPYRCKVVRVPRGEGVCEHYVPIKKEGE